MSIQFNSFGEKLKIHRFKGKEKLNMNSDSMHKMVTLIGKRMRRQ